MRIRKRLVIIGAGVVAAVLAVGGIAGVAAQTSGGDQASNPVSTFIDKLAGNLGIGSDQLKSAIDQTRDQMVDEAVADGKITPQQGDQLKQRSVDDLLKRFDNFDRSDGDANGGPKLHRFAGGHPGLFGGLDEAANIIGIDRATLMQELMSGKSLAQVAQDHGVSRDDLKQGLLDRYGQRLDQLLDRTFDPGSRGDQAAPSPSGTPSATPSGASSS
jgi:hypothetical protein